MAARFALHVCLVIPCEWGSAAAVHAQSVQPVQSAQPAQSARPAPRNAPVDASAASDEGSTPSEPLGSRHGSQAPAMEDARGFAVGIAAEWWRLRKKADTVFGDDGPPVGVGAWLRYDVARLGPTWALGLMLNVSHREEGITGEPPSGQSLLQGTTAGLGAQERVLAPQAFINTLLLGAELRHGVAPWLIPFARVSGGIAFVDVEVSDSAECAERSPIRIPGGEVPAELADVQICTAYRAHERSAAVPALGGTLGVTLRPVGEVARVVPAPIGLSLEVGYLFMPKTSLSPAGLDDTALGRDLSALDLSSWLLRASLHVWF